MADEIAATDYNSSGMYDNETQMIYTGPKFGPTGQALMVTLYSLIAFLAFTGNMIVIFVELYGKRSARNLQKFLINLAISDLLLGVFSVPFNYTNAMLGRWIFPEIMCPIAQWIQYISLMVNTFTLSFIGLERYFATLYPLSSANTWIRSNYNVVLFLGWIFGAVYTTIINMNVKIAEVRDIELNVTYPICDHWGQRTNTENQIYLSVNFGLTFVLPVIFLSISYGAIGRRLLHSQQHWCSFKQSAPFSGNSSRMPSSLSSLNAHSAGHNSLSDCHSVNAKSGFIRGKPSRKSIKSSNGGRSMVKVGRSKSNQSVDSLPKNSRRCKSVRMFASQENVPTEENGTVLIRFDRRNTEFLNKVRVFRLLLAVLLVFTLFWLPIKVLILVVAFSPQNGNESFLQTTTFWIIYFAFHLLCMTTSFANPVLYSFLSKSFRADFIDLFVCICTKLQVGQKSTNQLQRSNQPPTPQTFQHNNHFHYSSVRPINSHGNVINVANSRLASIKENKAEPIERIRLTEHRSHSSRASSSVSNSGGSDTVRSNNSKNKSKHSRHSNNTSKQHSARSSVFDDF